MEKEWYVVNTYSGHEAKVKEKLESRAVSMGMQDHIFRVIVPETTEVDVKDGVKKEKVKKPKVKCKVRKVQKFFFVLLVLAAIAVAVCYGLGLLDSVVSYVKAKINYYNTTPVSQWVARETLIRDLAARFGVLFAGLLAVVVVVSFLIRFILHPLGCKAKKQKRCCKADEHIDYIPYTTKLFSTSCKQIKEDSD